MTDPEARLASLADELTKKIIETSNALGLDKRREAKEIAGYCDVLNKPHDRRAFADVATALLSYPPELGFAIAMEFADLESQMGFNPYGTIMTLVAKSESLCQGMIARKDLIDKRQDIFEVMTSKEFRINRAGELLAIAIIVSSENLLEAATMYRHMYADISVRERAVQVLQSFDADLCQRITGSACVGNRKAVFPRKPYFMALLIGASGLAGIGVCLYMVLCEGRQLNSSIIGGFIVSLVFILNAALILVRLRRLTR